MVMIMTIALDYCPSDGFNCVLLAEANSIITGGGDARQRVSPQPTSFVLARSGSGQCSGRASCKDNNNLLVMSCTLWLSLPFIVPYYRISAQYCHINYNGSLYSIAYSLQHYGSRLNFLPVLYCSGPFDSFIRRVEAITD